MRQERTSTDGDGQSVGYTFFFQIAKDAERRRRYGDDVVALVGKPLAFRVAVLYRSEHRAEEQRKPVGILMHRPDGLSDEVSGVAADLADRRMPLEDKTVLSLHGQPDVH